MEATTQPTETTPPAGLYMKLVKVMAQIQRLPKTGHNKQQNYDFTTESDLTDFIRPKLAEVGVFLFTSMDSVEQTPYESKSGTPGVHTRASFTFTFVDAETGETRSSQWTSESMDFGDKSINKAATAATKFFLLRTFLISTGDPADDADNESPEIGRRQPPPPRQPIPQRQPNQPDPLAAKRLEAVNLGNECYADEWPERQIELCKAISVGHVQSVDGLNQKELETLIAGIQKKLAEAKADKPAQPTENAA